MSQNAFKELTFLSGLIQYSPSFWKKPESRMSLQEWPGWLKYKPLVAEKEISFDLDGFINLHTTVKTLKKGKKAICKLEHDCLHLSSGKGFKRSPQLKINTTLIALQNPVFFWQRLKWNVLEQSHHLRVAQCFPLYLGWHWPLSFFCFRPRETSMQEAWLEKQKGELFSSISAIDRCSE